MSKVVPFPRVKNRPFIIRHAIRMTEMAPDKGEAHLRRLLDEQAEKMRSRSIAEAAIAGEVKAIEAAVRAELWRAVLTPGGAA